MFDEYYNELFIDLLSPVIRSVQEAGTAIMNEYNADICVASYKQDQSPVTKADIISRNIIPDGFSRLAESWPVISEEALIPPFEQRRDLRYMWMVDPLDGTKELISRTGEFTVNIALIENNQPVLGIIYAPAKTEIYFAARGCGTYMDECGSVLRIFFSRTRSEPMRVVVSASHQPENPFILC